MKKSRADWVHKQELSHILAALMPYNRLALEISMATGLRISDVLSIKTEQVMQTKDGRITVRQLKTGKPTRVRLPAELLNRCRALSGRVWVFTHRLDQNRHRTRQAVWKDLKRAAMAFRVKYNLSPHSARKSYAVAVYERTGDIAAVQKRLAHSSAAVTMLYALADELTDRRLGRRSRS